jgi:hypothetical protein
MADGFKQTLEQLQAGSLRGKIPSPGFFMRLKEGVTQTFQRAFDPTALQKREQAGRIAREQDQFNLSNDLRREAAQRQFEGSLPLKDKIELKLLEDNLAFSRDRLRRDQNFEANLRRIGVSGTLPDVFPQPFTSEQQERFDKFREKQEALGFTDKEIRDQVFEKTKAARGFGTVVLPANFETLREEDLNPRDPDSPGLGKALERSPGFSTTQTMLRELLKSPQRK